LCSKVIKIFKIDEINNFFPGKLYIHIILHTIIFLNFSILYYLSSVQINLTFSNGLICSFINHKNLRKFKFTTETSDVLGHAKHAMRNYSELIYDLLKRVIMLKIICGKYSLNIYF